MNELTKREWDHFEYLDTCDLGKKFFNKAWDLQQSRIDELVNALEKIGYSYDRPSDMAITARKALEKHKKYKEDGE
jgi:hypothetical protein